MCGLSLGLDERIRLTVIGAALGMTDDHGGRATIGEHLSREIAGMGASRQRMAVLRAESDVASNKSIPGAAEERRWWAHHEVRRWDRISFDESR
jgi:hypothetical protein